LPSPLPVDCQVCVHLSLLRGSSALRMLVLGVAVACVAPVAITVRVAGWMPVVAARYPWIARYAF